MKLSNTNTITYNNASSLQEFRKLVIPDHEVRRIAYDLCDTKPIKLANARIKLNSNKELLSIIQYNTIRKYKVNRNHKNN
jgi:hypothetical protein